MKIVKQIDVRLNKKFAANSLRVVQYDTGIQLVFNVLDFTLPSGTTATLYVRKKSGKFVYQEDGITVSENTVTVDLENQALTEHGETFYQVRFVNGEDIISTFAGSMWVERSLADADAVESKTVIAAFDAKTAEEIAKIVAATDEYIALAKDQIEAKGAATLETIPEDYTQMDSSVKHLYNESANAIKGNVSGSVVAVADVSPLEHNPVVKVHGKNLIPWVAKTGTNNGTTYTMGDDGSLTIDKTPTSGFHLSVAKWTSPVALKGVYTLSIGTALPNGSYFWLKDTNDTPTQLVMYQSSGVTTKTVELNGTFTELLLWASIDGSFNNHKFFPMLEKGNTATDYEPYIDPSTVTVKRVSKNLIDRELMKSESTLNGVTITRNGDVLTMNGTLTTDSVLFNTHFCLHGGLNNFYTLSYEYMGGTVNGVSSVCIGDCETVDSARQSWVNIKMQNSDNGYSCQMTKPFIKDMWFYAMAGVVFTDYKIRIQLEPGKEATDFEPCNGAEYFPESDGTVPNVTSLSPNMTIMTDTDGVIVECEYNHDTKTYIDKLASNSGVLLTDTVTGRIYELKIVDGHVVAEGVT